MSSGPGQPGQGFPPSTTGGPPSQPGQGPGPPSLPPMMPPMVGFAPRPGQYPMPPMQHGQHLFPPQGPPPHVGPMPGMPMHGQGMPFGGPPFGPPPGVGPPPGFQMNGAPGPMPGPGGPLGPPPPGSQGPPSGPPPGFPGMPPGGSQAPSGPPGGPPPGSSTGGGGRSDWTEHTAPDGRKYYFHTRTKQSSWEKPEDLMTLQEKADASTNWKEYTSPDGRKYYFNKQSKESRWTMPEDLKKARDAGGITSEAEAAPSTRQSETPPPGTPGPGSGPTAAAAAAAAGPSDDGRRASTATPPATAAAPSSATHAEDSGGEEPSGRKDADGATPSADASGRFQYATKAEAKDAFKAMLAAINCASDWSWEQAVKAGQNDPRFGALKAVGEKKVAFNEYLQQRRNDEREEGRRRARAARDAFVRLLEESREVRASTSFKRAKEVLEDDPVWQALPEREREELFDDSRKEREKREREVLRAEKKRRMDLFKELLMSRGHVKPTTKFRDVVKRLETDEICEMLDKVERLEVFAELVKDIERGEAEEKERAAEANRRRERQHRDTFKAMLREHRDLGLITVKSRWFEYGPAIEHEEPYLAVKRNTGGSRPRELFEDLIEDMEEEFEKAKVIMKDYLKERELEPNVVGAMAYETLEATLEEGMERVKKVSDMYRRAFYDEVAGAARLRERKAREEFSLYLRSSKRLMRGDVSSWEEWVAGREGAPELRAVGEATAAEMFDDLVAKLRDSGVQFDRRRLKSDDFGEGEPDDERDKKKKKKHSKRYDRSDDEDSKAKKHKREKELRERPQPDEEGEYIEGMDD